MLGSKYWESTKYLLIGFCSELRSGNKPGLQLHLHLSQSLSLTVPKYNARTCSSHYILTWVQEQDLRKVSVALVKPKRFSIMENLIFWVAYETSF